jgi:acyl-CoA synthetase (AMP-forming)/AMP-acid ligase II
MTRPTTLLELLRAGAADAPAIRGPGRDAMTYRQLREQVARTIASLNARGIGRNDRVAIVLPNGPVMATAFVSIASGASTAPLNPAYKRAEFEFYLADLNAKALLTERTSSSDAVAVAHELGIEVIEIDAREGGPAGEFALMPPTSRAPAPTPSSLSGSDADDRGKHAGSAGSRAARFGQAAADDEALVLHTSGTTSRPKIVPLRQRNICASAENIRASLSLLAGDCCLNVMPLFHIHGLMAAVLGTLSAGASVFCAPGFNALKFFAWLGEAYPTWYTAVPTMHQAILSRVQRNPEAIEACRIRFIRSSSSSLPPQVMAELEQAFGAPVIEAYGMTEASHQMTSNPLPPLVRKPGTVGIAAGPEVAVMNEGGHLLPPGTTGEVVIRGTSVTTGYANNPEANASCFTNGWFRTGDQGVIDADGYLSITGRLKEIINRGGEKIAPREVDEVLMDHPAVQQVVTFAVPDEKLGEDVAAAVVLREGAQVTHHELRDFAASRLAAFKVPRTLLFVDEIPKGPTGKLQRIGLASKLGLGKRT